MDRFQNYERVIDSNSSNNKNNAGFIVSNGLGESGSSGGSGGS